MSELYISFDLETVGGDPAKLPIINAGFVAYIRDVESRARKRVAQLSVNMVPGEPEPKQLEWWHSTPELARTYASFALDAKAPAQAMAEIRDWIAAISRPVGVAYRSVYMVAMPTIFDGSLLYAYWVRFLGHPAGGKGPGFTMIDVRSYGAGCLGCSYAEANKTKALAPYMPDTTAFPHTHTGVDDAEEQLLLLFNLMDQSTAVRAAAPVVAKKAASRLVGDDLRDTAQCRACLATWPRASLDWSKAKRVCIGTNDSWGNWKVYSNFLSCSVCGELAVGDEKILTGP